MPTFPAGFSQVTGRLSGKDGFPGHSIQGIFSFLRFRSRADEVPLSLSPKLFFRQHKHEILAWKQVGEASRGPPREAVVGTWRLPTLGGSADACLHWSRGRSDPRGAGKADGNSSAAPSMCGLCDLGDVARHRRPRVPRSGAGFPVLPARTAALTLPVPAALLGSGLTVTFPALVPEMGPARCASSVLAQTAGTPQSEPHREG